MLLPPSTNTNVFPVKHNTNTNTNVFVNDFVNKPSDVFVNDFVNKPLLRFKFKIKFKFLTDNAMRISRLLIIISRRVTVLS